MRLKGLTALKELNFLGELTTKCGVFTLAELHHIAVSFPLLSMMWRKYNRRGPRG